MSFPVSDVFEYVANVMKKYNPAKLYVNKMANNTGKYILQLLFVIDRVVITPRMKRLNI